MMRNNISHCPNCKVDLSYRSAQSPDEVLYRTIGVQIRGVYDGALFWTCPECNWAWHRHTQSDLKLKAKPYVNTFHFAESI